MKYFHNQIIKFIFQISSNNLSQYIYEMFLEYVWSQITCNETKVGSGSIPTFN